MGAKMLCFGVNHVINAVQPICLCGLSVAAVADAADAVDIIAATNSARIRIVLDLIDVPLKQRFINRLRPDVAVGNVPQPERVRSRRVFHMMQNCLHGTSLPDVDLADRYHW